MVEPLENSSKDLTLESLGNIKFEPPPSGFMLTKLTKTISSAELVS